MIINYNDEEIEKAVFIVTATIEKCEKMQHKFSEGTSQHTLLRNRIKALYISKALLKGDKAINYTTEELQEALPPVISIINKTTKAQSKYEKGSSQFNRFEPLILAMTISKEYILAKLQGD